MSNIGSSRKGKSFRTVGEKEAFIRAHYGTMSYGEMAAAMGCSRSTVHRRAKALGLIEEHGKKQIAAVLERIEREPAAPENDQLRRLYELRDMQHSCLRSGEISMQAFTSMSREYRETLRQIAELQAPRDMPVDSEPDIAGPMADLLAAMPDLSSLAAMPADG